ncbi:MAG: hypothetical protein H7334_09950 [Ferruginibacter sp.]|nr:hypothetical protein [Ferruginibacter sp.]
MANHLPVAVLAPLVRCSLQKDTKKKYSSYWMVLLKSKAGKSLAFLLL